MSQTFCRDVGDQRVGRSCGMRSMWFKLTVTVTVTENV